MKFFQQFSHGSLLSRRSRVVGLTADVEPALVAHADRVGVVILAVGADHPFRTAWLYRSVSSDHVVVADAELPALSPMPSFRLAPELTALPLSVTVEDPLPLVEIVSAKPLC